jgi:hypothetical protein
MFVVIAAILVLLWIFGFFVIHISSFLIHILLLAGFIMLIVHFFRGRSGAS